MWEMGGAWVTLSVLCFLLSCCCKKETGRRECKNVGSDKTTQGASGKETRHRVPVELPKPETPEAKEGKLSWATEADLVEFPNGPREPGWTPKRERQGINAEGRLHVLHTLLARGGWFLRPERYSEASKTAAAWIYLPSSSPPPALPGSRPTTNEHSLELATGSLLPDLDCGTSPAPLLATTPAASLSAKSAVPAPPPIPSPPPPKASTSPASARTQALPPTTPTRSASSTSSKFSASVSPSSKSPSSKSGDP